VQCFAKYLCNEKYDQNKIKTLIESVYNFDVWSKLLVFRGGAVDLKKTFATK